MKNLIHITAIACLMLLASCSQEEPATGNDGGSQEGYTVLIFSFGHPVTYAADALPKEKVINSVAVFVSTPGGFFSYFSTEPNGSEKGLHLPLVQVAEGRYTMGVKVATQSTANAGVYILANYAEAQYNLTTDLKALTSMDELKALKTPAMTDASAGPQTPLLMYAQFTASLADGAVLDRNITLKHLASRIDVIDNVGDAAKFKLISASLLNPKSQCFVYGTDDRKASDVAAIPTLGRFADKDAVGNAVSRLYTYESTAAESSLLTVAVICEISGVETIKLITIRQKGNASAYAPIKRNSYHGINIYWDSDNSTVSFTVSDWDDGGDL